MAVDELSYRPYLILNYILASPRDFHGDIRRLEINVVTKRDKPMLYTMKVQHSLIKEIQASQSSNLQLERIRVKVKTSKVISFVSHKNRTLRF